MARKTISDFLLYDMDWDILDDKVTEQATETPNENLNEIEDEPLPQEPQKTPKEIRAEEIEKLRPLADNLYPYITQIAKELKQQDIKQLEKNKTVWTERYNRLLENKPLNPFKKKEWEQQVSRAEHNVEHWSFEYNKLKNDGWHLHSEKYREQAERWIRKNEPNKWNEMANAYNQVNAYDYEQRQQREQEQVMERINARNNEIEENRGMEH